MYFVRQAVNLRTSNYLYRYVYVVDENYRYWYTTGTRSTVQVHVKYKVYEITRYQVPGTTKVTGKVTGKVTCWKGFVFREYYKLTSRKSVIA